MRSAFITELANLAEKDSGIYLITGDLGFGVLEDFEKKFPDRFINAGVSEQAMMGMAAGLAEDDNLVFVYSIGNFPTLRCLEQIRNDVSYMNRSVVIVSVGAGFAYGAQGYTHHSLEDVAALRALSGISIYSPCDSFEATESLNKIVSERRPAYIRLGKNFGNEFHNEPWLRFKDQFPTVKEGGDGTILVTGSLVSVALEAADDLSRNGFDVGVNTCPIISPLPLNHLIELIKNGPIVVVEEHVTRGGLYSAILENLAEVGLASRIRSVSVSGENQKLLGSQDFLRSEHGLTPSNIVKKFMLAREDIYLG